MTLTDEEKLNAAATVAVPSPYRSPLEDGIYDVRTLYSDCFYKHVTKIAAQPLAQDVACELDADDALDLAEHLRLLTI